MSQPTTWIRRSAPNATPVIYKEKGAMRFCAFRDGEEPWTYVITRLTGVTRQECHNVIDAYNVAGLKQHDFKGGFAEATREITTD